MVYEELRKTAANSCHLFLDFLAEHPQPLTITKKKHEFSLNLAGPVWLKTARVAAMPSSPVDGKPNGVPKLSISEGASATFADGHRCQHCGNPIVPV
jgi:hypothetical protein